MLLSILVPQTCSLEEDGNSLNVGLEFCFDLVFELLCNCPCVVDLWLKVARSLNKPVEVTGAVFILLAHAGSLSASKKSHFLAGKVAAAQRAQFRCGADGFVPTFTTAKAEALNDKCVTVQPNCPAPSQGFVVSNTLNKFVPVFVDEFRDAHAF